MDYFRATDVIPSISPVVKDRSANYIITIAALSIVLAIIVVLILYFTGVFNKKEEQVLA